MNRTRTTRVLAVVTFSLAGALAGALVAAPVSARGSKQELSRKVVVTGTALATSDKLGTAADPAIGKVAPVLVGQGFNGKNVTIGGPGKPRAVIFLAHWCPHCQREVPLVVKLAKQGKLDGLKVDTVTTSTNSKAPNFPPSAWLGREKWPFKNVLNDDSRQRAMVAYGGTGYPYFVFLDAEGKVVVRESGELPSESIVAIAKKVAAGQPAFP